MNSRVAVLNRVDHQTAYVLTSQPWRETSLLVEVLSRDYGRLSLIARSARRPRSILRGVLMPFAPLTVSWFGKHELRTLYQAEWQEGVVQLDGLCLWSGFYMNELILRLTGRDDPMPQVFDPYDEAIRALAMNQDLTRTLRHFELSLLNAFGYALTLDVDIDGEPVLADRDYLCQPGFLPQAISSKPMHGLTTKGAVLLALAQRDFSSTQVSRFAKKLAQQCFECLLPNGVSVVRETLSGVSALSDINTIMFEWCLMLIGVNNDSVGR